MKPTTALRTIAIATRIETGCWLTVSGTMLTLTAFVYATLIY
jgi:hypothetical protein